MLESFIARMVFNWSVMVLGLSCKQIVNLKMITANR